MKKLKTYANLTYSGSREYTTKKGEKKTLYRFIDSEQAYIESCLPEPLNLDAGTVCTCCILLGQVWLESERRYERYFRVISAVPAKTK